MCADFLLLASACQAAKKSLNFEPSSVTFEDASKLPMEDGIWVIAIVDGPGADDFDQTAGMGDAMYWRMMSVIDENGKIIAGSAKDSRQTDVQQQALELFKQALFAPLTWKPRRPRYVGFRNDTYFTELPLNDLGAEKISMFTGALGPDLLPEVLQQRRACTTCRVRGQTGLFETCPKCEVIYYCSKDCMLSDFEHKHDDHGHKEWCAKMKQFTSYASQLAQLPFTFIQETTSIDFHEKKLRDFLRDHGVLNHGYWRWEYFENDMPAFGELGAECDPVVLPHEGEILDTVPQECAPALKSWADYYKWRGFSLDSPISVLLQWPLTIFHILTEHVTAYPGGELSHALSGQTPIIIHIIGVEKEADLVPLFWELGHLFPESRFHLVLLGTHISVRVNRKQGEGHRVKATLIRGLYQEYKDSKPHIAICFNAGLAAYSSWGDALRKLKEQRTPVYFTDYCQYSCECAKLPIEGLHIGTVTTPLVNPFRSPIFKYCEEHSMPWYSNCFIYSIEYAEYD